MGVSEILDAGYGLGLEGRRPLIRLSSAAPAAAAEGCKGCECDAVADVGIGGGRIGV